MIQITPHMRILLAVEPVDLRKGIDGLAALIPAASFRRFSMRRVKVNVTLFLRKTHSRIRLTSNTSTSFTTDSLPR